MIYNKRYLCLNLELGKVNVLKGIILEDGAARVHGELILGKNVVKEPNRSYTDFQKKKKDL